MLPGLETLTVADVMENPSCDAADWFRPVVEGDMSELVRGKFKLELVNAWMSHVPHGCHT